MGERAVVICRKKRDGAAYQEYPMYDYSPSLYLHWSGPEVPEIVAECNELMKDRMGDLDYYFARLVGICHVRIPGNLSMGVFNRGNSGAPTKSESPGDHGVFTVDVDTGEFTQEFNEY